jgi:type II secretory ATPase GspE/PulE/Tfp pilus assembly ATPase PilB-like protein
MEVKTASGARADKKTLTTQIIHDGLLGSFINYMPNPDDIAPGTFDSYKTYRDMRADESTIPLLPGIMDKAEMYQYRMLPLERNESLNSINFGITLSTPESHLKELNDHYAEEATTVTYTLISDSAFRALMKRYDPPKTVEYANVEISDDDKSMIDQVSETLDEVKSDDILNYLVTQADALGASDIHLENQRDQVRIRFRIDGTLHPIAFLTHDKFRMLFAAIASAADLSVAAETAQSGHIVRDISPDMNKFKIVQRKKGSGDGASHGDVTKEVDLTLDQNLRVSGGDDNNELDIVNARDQAENTATGENSAANTATDGDSVEAGAQDLADGAELDWENGDDTEKTADDAATLSESNTDSQDVTNTNAPDAPKPAMSDVSAKTADELEQEAEAYRNQPHTLNMRIETVPTTYGQDVVIRLFNFSRDMLNLDVLGLDNSERKELDEIVSHPRGLVMVVGPTGSGKSTTLYSILNALNDPSRKIITLEDPVEFDIPGVTQIPVDTTHGASFADNLRAVLRLDPDVVMVGEIRDADTAKTAIQASITGHLVLCTFHAQDAAAAFSRMIDMIGTNPVFATAVRVVIGQRLVRRLDPDTKIAYEPSTAEKKYIHSVLKDLSDEQLRANLPDSIEFHTEDGKREATYQLFKPGTSDDDPFGYRGRAVLMEQLVVDEKIQGYLRGDEKKLDAGAIAKDAAAQGMITMLQKGVLKVLAGETTLDEVNRVL